LASRNRGINDTPWNVADDVPLAQRLLQLTVEPGAWIRCSQN
jgi:hypothetical protein